MDPGWFATSLVVSDIGQSLAFYRALGFHVADGSVDIRTVTVRRGDCLLTLFQDVLDPAETQLTFWQGDVPAIAQALVARGIAFEGGWPRQADDGGHAAMLRDPDGHLIYLINLPVHYADHPRHAHERPARTPGPGRTHDMQLGWYEPSLEVRHIATSIEFYANHGFQRVADGSVARTATVQNNDCRIGLYQGYLDPPTFQLIFWQGQVEAIADTAAAAQLPIFKPPTRDGTGGMGMMLKDPDGHPLYFINLPSVERTETAPR